MQTRTRVDLDLNARTADGYFRVSQRRADGPLALDEKVVAFESEDGHAYLAWVRRFDGRFVELELLWETREEDSPAAHQDFFTVSFGTAATEAVGPRGFQRTPTPASLAVV